jgi:predicted permease
MFELVVGILLPLFVLVWTGFCIARWMKVDLNPISRINMDIFLPALVFASLSTMPLDMTKIPLLGAALMAILILGKYFFNSCELEI